VRLERRQQRERLEVGLGAGALAVVVGEVAAEDAPEPTGRVGGEPEDAEVQLVVSEDVHEVAPAGDAAGRAHVRRPAGCRSLLQVEVAQLVQLERSEILRDRALPIHARSRPRSGQSENSEPRRRS
jgi:hypothetical protein